MRSDSFTITSPHAIDVLAGEHERLQQLFAEPGRAAARGDRSALVAAARCACLELGIHLRIEGEIVQPIVRTVLDAQQDAAIEFERELVRQFVVDLERMGADDPAYAGALRHLARSVHHHFEQQERVVFPALLAARVDLDMLAADLRDRRRVLSRACRTPSS